ncbi:MAG: prepilin peptidase [Alphaproteobacteria bacterium]|nr:prepilin peptidase [Alphaproteobacteria bacterium]
MTLVLLSFFPVLMAYAAVSDLATMTLPNWLSAALVVGFLALALIAGLSLPTVGLCVALGLAVLLVGLALFAFGWVGGGDVKLATAIAMWMGVGDFMSFLVLMSVLGGAFTLAILLFRKLPLPAGLVRFGWLSRLHDQAAGVPYGVALAAAALLVYPETALFSGLAA